MMRRILASVALVAPIAFVASLFGRARRPRLLPRCRVASIAVSSRSTVASTVAVSAFRLVVASVASFASRSFVGVTASIVVATIAIGASVVAAPAGRTVPVTSPAFALACVAARVFGAACFAPAANLRFHGPLRAVPEAVHLGTFERAVVQSLREQRLKIRRKRINCLVGQFFTASHVLVAVLGMVRHIVPLHRELFARRWRLAGGK